LKVVDHKIFKIAIGGDKEDGSMIRFKNMMLVEF
jgi:hypothetical protein